VHIRLILDKFGWRKYFPVTVGGDEVARVKPAPEAFRKALEMMYGEPEQTMVIGDTINDILAARAAGLACTAVRSPFGGSGELAEAGPTYIIDSIERLPAVLENHFTQEV
jgi:phosphoglycolate phosphatase